MGQLKQVTWKNGASGGMNCWAGLNARTNSIAFVIANINSPHTDSVGQQLLAGPPPKRSVVTVSSEVLSGYVGSYRFPGTGHMFNITCVNSAVCDALQVRTASSELELFPFADNMFFLANISSQEIYFLKQELVLQVFAI